MNPVIDSKTSEHLKPLVVDLDGTLIRTDLLYESFLYLLAHDPIKALLAVLSVREGKANLKFLLAKHAKLDIPSLPVNAPVLDFLNKEAEKGRSIYIASAANERYVEEISKHFGIFSGYFGSNRHVNLSGDEKAKLLCSIFGEKGFDYIGDALVDYAVWKKSDGIYIANATAEFAEKVREWAPTAVSIGTASSRRQYYLKALRIHQWLKNSLIFIPALAAHQVGFPIFWSVIAFFSFSLCASSVYILNDLLDLRGDRAHPRKRRRPFASGDLSITAGFVLIPLLFFASIALALALPASFMAVLFGYYALTCAYSFYLKRKLLVDVVVLACLYGSRIVAGAAAASVIISPWLTVFAIFFFLGLAIVKRCAELSDRKHTGMGNPIGRAYYIEDLPLLEAMSIASGYVAVLVLALYVQSEFVTVLYTHSDRLWLLCIPLIYWISRMTILTKRGIMHDDPVVFAVKDRVSQMVAVSCALIIMLSI